MEQPGSSSPLRFLIRPSPPSTTSVAASASAAPAPAPASAPVPAAQYQDPASAAAAVASTSTSSSSAASPPVGVVVVGFLGSKPSTDFTHLINCLLNANAFGSGNLDQDLLPPSIPAESFRHRRLSYYHEPEKGMVFLHYSPSSPSMLQLLSISKPATWYGGASSVLEEYEGNDLRVMLLMFSVCHVIVFVHEGLRFDLQILKKFRMLQAAKHAFTPFVRSQIAPLFCSKQSAPFPQPSGSRPSSVSPTSRRGGSSSRHGSAISLMSGTGSHQSMLPGQCIPVVLFVFEDDFSDNSSSVSSTEDSSDVSRQNLTLKGSGSVIMLARPPSKAEGSFRKRVHSSLEAQIRFLIKKCKVLVGTDHSHFGSRGVGNVNSLPLFSVDASRVVALLDRSMNHRGEPLSFVTSLIEDALNSNSKVDVLMLENHIQNLHNEDIQSIKDFILRHVDMLRGRGGLPGNANSGSVAGVGMVAAAAAAAAASAAAGKPVSAPELPSLEDWFTLTTKILEALLSIGHGFIDDIGNINRSPPKRSAETHDEHAVEAAISCLESSNALNMRFSISWCQRALPAAKEVYLKDIPAFYATSMHNAQLQKALLAFYSMVKGPAVKLFEKKLADECTSIWESGRQLCDTVSLTGKPCMHRRHDGSNSIISKEDAVNQHSSGYVFLHACACGRSRRLREDPFDYESANITFNHFANCENLLPTLLLSNLNSVGPLPPTSWSLLRVGGAGYYEPSKGLLQTGFCSTQKFLMKWTISIAKRKESNDFSVGVNESSSLVSLNPGPKAVLGMEDGTKKSYEAKFPSDVQHSTTDSKKKLSELVPSNATSISFGKGLPSFTMKKPFAEVVAGTAAASSTTLALQKRKQTKDVTDKGIRQSGVPTQNDAGKNAIDDHQGSQKSEHIYALASSIKPETNYQTNGDPYLQIGTNIVPVNMLSGGKINKSSYSEQFTVFVGFEHECSYGHRFILSHEHLKDLDSSYSLTSTPHSTTDGSEEKYAENKNKVPEQAALTNIKKDSKLSASTAASGGHGHESFALFSRQGMENLKSVRGLTMLSESVYHLEGKFSHVSLDDGSSAFSILNTNLPIYMNCPHCSNSDKQTQQKVKFASKISQLQRIFVVTPPFPAVLATCPVIQFEESCLPPSTPDRKLQSHFSFGCRVILPPESFLTLRLPFIYGVQRDDGILQPLNHLEHKPELTAWLAKGTALQLVSVGHESNEEFHMQ